MTSHARPLWSVTGGPTRAEGATDAMKYMYLILPHITFFLQESFGLMVHEQSCLCKKELRYASMNCVTCVMSKQSSNTQNMCINIPQAWKCRRQSVARDAHVNGECNCNCKTVCAYNTCTDACTFTCISLHHLYTELVQTTNVILTWACAIQRCVV